MAAPVSRARRKVDLAVLLLILAGAGAYVYGWRGLRELQVEQQYVKGDLPFAALRKADRFYNLSRLGLGLVVTGVVVAVGAAVRASRMHPGDP